MTYEQYWEGNPHLVSAYREADKLRRDRVNQEAWLQGMYVYDAIARISPILHAFAKKGTKPQPYVDRPYAMTEEQIHDKRKSEEKATYERGKAFMEAFMFSNNKKFEERK